MILLSELAVVLSHGEVCEKNKRKVKGEISAKVRYMGGNMSAFCIIKSVL